MFTPQRLSGIAAILLTVTSSLQAASPAEKPLPKTDVAAPVSQPTNSLPQAPTPVLTMPLYLRPTGIDYGRGTSPIPNPLRPFMPRNYTAARFANSATLASLLRDGNIYISLSDAVTLALENNFDIAIARINLDIADTDILRAKTGLNLRGVSTGVVANTLGGATSTITGGGGPGGTTSASGGSGTGANGLVLSTNGSGPTPEAMDPVLTGTLQYESLISPQSNLLFSGGLPSVNTGTGTYNFGYQQGFSTGTLFNVAFNNTRVTTNNSFSTYSPTINTMFKVTATQHLLQGFGPGINRRLIVQAKNDRQITDSAFRQQVLYTINQVENIYWALVSAYEDVQDKTEAVNQSARLTAENRRQVEIGSLAGLDALNSDSAAATDRQALVAAKSNLRYQQLLMKQALVRNLNDPQIAKAPIIPTDRISLDRLPEEDMQPEDLVHTVISNNPQVEQAVLNMKNNEITIRAEKNALLPTVDLVGFYGGSALAGAQSSNALNFQTGQPYAPGTFPSVGYGTAFGNLFNNSAPDKGVALNITIPLRNRAAQADQARSQMELEQSQMRLEQIYTQIQIQVTNAQLALDNDRAQVEAAQAAKDYAQQSLHSEERKNTLGASTQANVLQQKRNLAVASNNLISANAAYARDRSALLQLSGKTIERYGFDLQDAATGNLNHKVQVPGVVTATPTAPVSTNPRP